MSKKDGSSNVIGGIIFFIVLLVALIPKPVWIFLGVIAALSAFFGLVYWIVITYEKWHAAAQERAREEQAAVVAAAKREREERARREKQHRLDTLGKDNAARVEAALSAVKRVAGSEAARAGWLGDVDFGPDIEGITDSFQKAHALRGVANRLSALDKLIRPGMSGGSLI